MNTPPIPQISPFPPVKNPQTNLTCTVPCVHLTHNVRAKTSTILEEILKIPLFSQIISLIPSLYFSLPLHKSTTNESADLCGLQYPLYTFKCVTVASILPSIHSVAFFAISSHSVLNIYHRFLSTSHGRPMSSQAPLDGPIHCIYG